MATEVELFNNSGAMIKLDVENKTIVLKPGESAKFYDREFGNLTIELSDTRQAYELKTLIPESFISWHGWSWWQSRRARVQLEPDGRLWLVAVQQQLPATTFEEQPKGFPIAPHAV